METSAPKRRKTSPLTALPMESTRTKTTTTTTPPSPPPAPQPFHGDAPQGDDPKPARASYASPTKASLLRHNPDILLRRLSSPSKGRVAGDGLGGTQTDPVPQPQLGGFSPQPDTQLREDHKRATSLYQRSDAGQSRSPTRQLGGGLAARPRRTPVKPNPRPLPPPGPDDEDDVLNPFAGRVLRRSPLAGLPEPDPQEPELPPTPVHPDDDAASTPPTGIHSTPSRRPRRSRALAEKVRSSPTKQPPVKPAADVLRHGDENILPTTETEPQPAFVQHQAMRKVNSRDAKTTSRPRPSSVRRVQTADADAEKKRERDALRAEVAQLERDLDIAAQENERIRQLQLGRKEVVMPRHASDIFDLLRRHLAPPQKDISADQADAWVQAAMDPTAFLPFGKPSSSLPTLFPEDSSTVEPEQEPISHRPVPLTTREALPFLQAFTPLQFTSRTTILPHPTRDTSNEDGPEPRTALLQHHSITATSDSGPGLFTARIDLTVDATTHAVTSLAVPSIDPPCAAAELSPLIAAVLAEPADSSSALSRNVGVLTWAMASWLRVAVRRAKVWRTLDRELGGPDALERTVARVRATGAGGKLKWKAAAGTAEEEDEAGDGVVADWIDSLVDTDELLPYMGRQWVDLRVLPSLAVGGGPPEAEVPVLRVQWHIRFDWTGEATSQIRALARLPGKWHHADDRTTLSGISALFDKLLQRGEGVVPAVSTIVTLLAGDPRG